MKFIIRGRFLMGEKMQPFKKEVNALNEKNAIEKIYCDLGSKHRVKRNKIIIEKVEKVE